MQKYMRLILVTGALAIVGGAHLMATMTFGYEAVAPLHKGDPVIGVAGTSATDELSVGYSQPAKLGVSSASVESAPAVSSDSLQQSSSASVTQSAPVKSNGNSLNSSSSAGSSVPMPADFKMPAPPSGVDLSKARL